MPVVTVGHVVTEAPPPDPRHDMLWMSIGILIGYFVISVIIKGLDKLRGNRTTKLGEYVHEIDSQKKAIATRERRISSLEADVQTRDATIQIRDSTILSERRARADAELEVERLTPFEREANTNRPVVQMLRNETGARQEEITRLRPFETEANDLRPQVGTLRDEIRDRNREIAGLKDDIRKIQGDLELAYQRFEVVNQRAAEGKDVERNLRSFIRERDVALERIKAQHEEQLETLREKHEDEKELIQQQREQEIEAVRRNANSELDGIIITKNRELEMLRRQRDMGPDPTSNIMSRRSELGSVSPLENFGSRSSISELHSRPSAHELDSGILASELSSTSEIPPKPGAGK